MARNEVVKADAGDWPVRNPWPWLAASIAVGVLALLLPAWSGTAGVLLRVLLILTSLLCAGGAVSLRLSFAGPDVDDRARSAGVVALAALAPLLGYATADREWDSFRLLLGVLTAVAVVGALLVLLPSVARRVAVSLLVLFHFGGILTAVLSVAPPAAEPSWVVSQLWARVYRPYLQFAYLNNAYHFYSPEPGPPCLLWFHVEYADGSSQWVRLPERDQFETRQEYQRRLALTESTNQLMPIVPSPEKVQARMVAGNLYGIPVYPGLAEGVQYHEPNGYSKVMVAAYARHVAHAYPNPKDPDSEVTGVKVYRVVRNMVSGPQMAAGFRPTDPSLFAPYYQGEFDKEGHLKNPQDPFLYWLIPIMWVPKDKTQRLIQVERKPDPEQFEIKDFTGVHATIKTPTPPAR